MWSAWLPRKHHSIKKKPKGFLDKKVGQNTRPHKSRLEITGEKGAQKRAKKFLRIGRKKGGERGEGDGSSRNKKSEKAQRISF